MLTQLPILLFLGGSYDLLLGFNRTGAGLDTLLFLCAAAPLVNLSWLAAGIVLLLGKRGGPRRRASIPWAVAAFLFLAESLAVAAWLLLQARM